MVLSWSAAVTGARLSNRALVLQRLWTAQLALDGYLVGQSDWTVKYAERHRAGLRVGTAITEGTANFLVNPRLNKAQQMRWTLRGADLLLQVRCAVYNGTLGSEFGQIRLSERYVPADGHRCMTPKREAVPLPCPCRLSIPLVGNRPNRRKMWGRENEGSREASDRFPGWPDVRRRW